MNQTFVAILFNKEYVNGKIYSFVPYCCVEGNMLENGEFIDSQGFEHHSIKTNGRGCLGPYYGFPISLEKLKGRYAGRSKNATLSLYLEEFKGNMYFGLNKGDTELEIVSLSLETLDGILEEGPKNESGRQFVMTPIKNRRN